MKHSLAILVALWFGMQALWALQDGNTLSAEQMVLSTAAMQERGIVVSSSLWQYHAGDDPQWANPRFDASSWVLVRPDFDASQLF